MAISRIFFIKHPSADDLVKVKLKQLFNNHHIDKVHFVMKLAKFAGRVMPTIEQN
jgi:hypothetical protein